MVMALPVPPPPRRRMGGRERSRALCTSHLGDEKNETASACRGGEEGRREPEWRSFQNKFPRAGGAEPASTVFLPFMHGAGTEGRSFFTSFYYFTRQYVDG